MGTTKERLALSRFELGEAGAGGALGMIMQGWSGGELQVIGHQTRSVIGAHLRKNLTENQSVIASFVRRRDDSIKVRPLLQKGTG